LLNILCYQQRKDVETLLQQWFTVKEKKTSHQHVATDNSNFHLNW